jgi:hypothetical protein
MLLNIEQTGFHCVFAHVDINGIVGDFHLRNAKNKCKDRNKFRFWSPFLRRSSNPNLILMVVQAVHVEVAVGVLQI